jgi:tetratricopeptide (TPR) repeat protein
MIPRAILAWLCLGSMAWSQNFETLFQRGVALQTAGHPLEAAAAYESALRVGRPNDGNYVYAQSNLAQTYISLGKYDQAEPILNRVLASYQAQYGPDHEDVGVVLGHLGSVYTSQGKFDQAAKCVERSFVIQLKYRPIESPRVLDTVKFLITILDLAGNLKEAITLNEALIKALEARLGPNDSRLRQPLMSLAGKRAQSGRFREAEELIQRAQHLPASDDQFASDPAREALTCASIYSEMGRYPEALEQLVRAEKLYTVRAQRLPMFKGLISQARLAQAEVLLELGQADRAVQLYEENLPAVEGNGDRTLAPHLYGLGVGYQRLGQLAKAEAVFRRVQSTETFPGWNRLNAGALLASILADRKAPAGWNRPQERCRSQFDAVRQTVPHLGRCLLEDRPSQRGGKELPPGPRDARFRRGAEAQRGSNLLAGSGSSARNPKDAYRRVGRRR